VSSTTDSSEQRLARTPTPLPLSVIFLTLYIDLIGFSVAFPLAPRMLEYYLEQEVDGGPLGWFLQRIQAVTPAAANASLFQAALFGGVLASLFGFLQFLFAPYWGARSDRLGRRPVLLVTVAGTAFSYLLWVFSGSFWVFVISRVVGGAMSGNLSVATAAVADVTTRENRAKGMGLVGAAFGLGFITGPAIGGLIGTVSVSPELARFGINPFSLVALVAFGFSLLNLVWISTRFRETLRPELRSTPQTERTRNPIAALLHLGSAGAKRANIAYFLFALIFSAFEATVSFLGAERLGYNERQLVLIFVFIGTVSIVTQGMLVRRLMPKIGEKTGTLAGLALVAAGLGILAFAKTAGPLYSGLAVLGVGSGFVNVGLSALVSLYSGAEEQGRALGIYRSLGSLARALGPLWAGLVFWWFQSQRMYTLAAVLMVVPILVGVLLPKPKK
jgi:MFS family permease